jgi:hypothetical protein
MSQSFSYDLSMPGSPADAQARVQEAVTEQMKQTAKMRPAGQDSNSLSFRPQWSWPLVAALFRVIGGKAVKLGFSSGNGGTHVMVSGKVGGDAEKIANRDFWAQMLKAKSSPRIVRFCTP